MNNQKTKQKGTSNEVVNESVNGSSVNYNGLDSTYPLFDLDLCSPCPMVQDVWEPKELGILKLTIKMKGLLEPLDGRLNGDTVEITDGLSRLLVLKELGWKKVPVRISELRDGDIQDRFVHKNIRTKRSISELVKHAEIILGVLGLSQGKRRKRIGDLDMGDDEFCIAGKDRFQIACNLLGDDIKASSLRRLMAVKDFVDSGDEEVKNFRIFDHLDSGEMKIHNAYNIMNNYLENKKEQGSNALTETLETIKGKNFTLYNKTCEDLSNVDDDSQDCVVTSPVYFQQRQYFNKDDSDVVIENEHGLERTPEEYIQKEVEIYREVYKKLKDTGSLFVVITDSYDKKVDCLIPERLMVEMKKDGWYVNQKWYWVKDNPKPQNNIKRLLPNVEYCIHFVKDPDKFYYREFKNWREGDFDITKASLDAGMGKKKANHSWTLIKPFDRFRSFFCKQHVRYVVEANGFRWNELEEIDPSYKHLAPFPSYIPLLGIMMTTKIGDSVLDIFNGSGTTTAVALQLGRKATGYDLDPKNHEFAGKRLNMVEENLPDLSEVKKLENEFFEEPEGDVKVA